MGLGKTVTFDYYINSRHLSKTKDSLTVDYGPSEILSSSNSPGEIMRGRRLHKHLDVIIQSTVLLPHISGMTTARAAVYGLCGCLKELTLTRGV